MVSSFVLVRQLQYGRHSLKPLILLKTQAASCLLSQTGLRCHGNMLWRSTYWDSAGWQVTVLAVRVFGPLSSTNLMPFLRTCSAHQSAEQPWFAFTSAGKYSVCIGLLVFVCSRTATQMTSFGNSKLLY